jgi:TatD DNase family protein
MSKSPAPPPAPSSRSEMSNWVDAHAHIVSAEMPLAASDLMAEAVAMGCTALVEVATDLSSLQRALELQQRFPMVAVAAAVTPHDAGEFDPLFLESIESLSQSGRLQAIGETGLDYFHWRDTERAQKRLCAQQMELAAERGLPLVIHCREAFDDFFSLLDQHYARAGRWLPGMLHCFTGTRAEAQRLLDQGWLLSFSGVLSYKKSHELREIAREAPLSQILIETDAPWLAPQSRRGQTNRPLWILETAEVLAQLKGLPVDEVWQAVQHNLRRLIPFTGWEDRCKARETQ